VSGRLVESIGRRVYLQPCPRTLLPWPTASRHANLQNS